MEEVAVAGHSLLEQIREGMVVQTADGAKPGKVTWVWRGAEPVNSYTACEGESCLAIDNGCLYIPLSIVADVSRQFVIMYVDAVDVHAKPWQWQPTWIPNYKRGSFIAQISTHDSFLHRRS